MAKPTNIYAVATTQAKKLGVTDFSEGSPGRKKREEIVRALKKTTPVSKADISKQNLAIVLQELIKSLDEYARME